PGDGGGQAQGGGAERVHRGDAVLVCLEGRVSGAPLRGLVPQLLGQVPWGRRSGDAGRGHPAHRVLARRVSVPLPRAAQGARFKRLGRPMPAVNRIQAEVPEGATVLPNPRGTAPGLWLEDARGRVAVLLPGVPREMRGLLVEEVLPQIVRRDTGVGAGGRPRVG